MSEAEYVELHPDGAVRFPTPEGVRAKLAEAVAKKRSDLQRRAAGVLQSIEDRAENGQEPPWVVDGDVPEGVITIIRKRGWVVQACGSFNERHYEVDLPPEPKVP